MTYRHLNTGATAELVEKKDLTVTLRTTDTNELKEIGSATFKRWWKPVPVEVVAEAVPEETETPTAEEPETQDAPTETTVAPVEPKPAEVDEDTPDEQEPATEAQDDDGAKPLALSEIVKKLEGLFDLLNGLYFEGKLPRPVITVQSTPKFYGHCSTKKIWKSGVEGEGEGQYEINIGAEFLNRPSENTAATMLHEMVHLYCRESDLDETCQKGRYHNKLFKQECEARDLEIGYDRAIGYSLTSPTEVFTEKLREAGYVLEVPFARHTMEKGKTKASREKAHKYICPICGQEVKTTAELNLICGNCEIPMERAD